MDGRGAGPRHARFDCPMVLTAPAIHRAIDVTPAPEGGRLLANGKVCLISRVRCTSQNASLKQYRKADALLRALLAKLDCDQMLGNEPDPERAYKAATLFFLAKAFKSYQAVHLLCSAGFFQDGAVLSRTIFEIFLQVSYMAGNPVERAPLFIKHDLVGRYFLYLKLKKYPDLVSDIEKRKENLEQLATQFKELEDQYHKGKGWWGNDLRWLAERVESDDNEAEKNYLRLYPLYSDLVHSTSSSVKHYIFTIAGRSTVDGHVFRSVDGILRGCRVGVRRGYGRGSGPREGIGQYRMTRDRRRCHYGLRVIALTIARFTSERGPRLWPTL
jgi:hypothetical protein